MAVDTILIDGTDLQTAARIIQVWEGVHATTPNRGDGIIIPGRDGVTDFDRPFDVGVLSLAVLVRGSSDVTGFNDAYRTLRRLVKPGSEVTLTRRQSFTTGTEDHTAKARYRSGLEPTMLTPADGRLVINFSILAGLWYGSAVTIGTGAVTVLGDVRTHRMTITLNGGTNPTITNSANGHSFTYNGATSSTTVDVENLSAQHGAMDASSALEWSGHTYPFELTPGAQTITCSSGTASISYQPAYL